MFLLRLMLPSAMLTIVHVSGTKDKNGSAHGRCAALNTPVDWLSLGDIL